MWVSSSGRIVDSQSTHRSSSLRTHTMPMAAKRRVSRKPAKKGLTAADKAATIVHLTDTVAHNIAHTDTHVAMTKRAGSNTGSKKHNLEHADRHVKGAAEHVKKLQQKLALDSRYKPAIRELKAAQKKTSP
jgi:hypothetical protein